MFRSRKQLDAHVRDVFSNCISESERLKHCLGVARQYAGIKEFDSARRYLETFVAANSANPANFAQLAEAHKFLGDVHQELGDTESALQSYKAAYTHGKGKDALNRVCDLITRGHGAQETTESTKHWMDLQKSSGNSNPFTPTGNSPAMPQRTLTPVGFGPPKIGFGHHVGVPTGNSSPLISSANTTNGGNVDLQLRYLEQRFDDGLGKIVDQNRMILEQILRLQEEMKDATSGYSNLKGQMEKLEKLTQKAIDNYNKDVELRIGQAHAIPTPTRAEPTASPIPPPLNTNAAMMTTNQHQTLSFAQQLSQSLAANKSTVDGVAPKKLEEEKASPFDGHLNTAGKFSFADLAQSNNSSFVFGIGGGETPSFAGAGAPIFSSSNLGNKTTTEEQKTPKESTVANTSASADDGDDDFVPTVEFQPAIPLPPLVEVRKGDENENTIVQYRAKLYRFVPEKKEWKERGVGNVKLLQCKDDPKKCRVVMWREKIGKIACNFSLFRDIKVTNNPTNPNVLCWKCQDFAEDSSWETFTLKFGSQENCAHFKQEMERLAKLTSATTDSPKRQSSPTAQLLSSQSNGHAAVDLDLDKNKNPSTVPLSQLFKKPEGSWKCGACYCWNSKELTICHVCETCRPGFENTGKEEATTGTVQPTFSFGFPTAKPVTPPTLNFGFNNSATVVAPAQVVDSSTAKKPDENKDSPFAGLNLSSNFSFADVVKTNNNSSFTDRANNNPGFTFRLETPSSAAAGTPLFASISANNKSSYKEKPSGVGTTAGNSAHADDGEDDFVPTVEFQPVMPLPPLVEVKKGDENENLIVEYRAKLYRFVPEAKEWKERGVGNIKLLQSKNDANKCRVVMWREKIGKIACNFSLYSDIKVTNLKGNPNVLCWKCEDCAEDPSWETFTLKFSNKESCEDFKTKLMEYAQGSGSANVTGGSFTETSSSCPGCVGCDVDSYQFPRHKQDSEEAVIDIPLAADASTVSPFTVSLNFFHQSGTSPQHSQTTPTQQKEELELKSDASSKPNSMSSFSLQTPEKNSTSSPTSFHFKSPGFSFKSPDGNSPSIFGGAGGGSIFSPAQGTPASGSAGSAFTSPFGQKLEDNSNSAPSVFSPFSFPPSIFQQSPLQANTTPDDGENEGERQEEDE